ncbi:MAG TPA: VapE domain-containing protein [Sphingomonas sp.]|jgi:hypothetical protein
MRYGATEAAWKHFADTLNLTADLLPIVANPNAVIAQRSTMKAVGKTPSVYDGHREVVGLGKWTERVTTRDAVERWAREPDYALSLQCRTVRAIDVDIPDPAAADAVEAVIVGTLGGIALPKRYRGNSGKRLFAFRYAGEMPKRVIPVEGGIIEFLGDGQQFVASGHHDSGVPYAWDCDNGLPAAIPTLTDDELEAVWSTLVALFATAEPTIARQRRTAAADLDIGPTTDSFGLWLAEHWDVYDTGRDGELYIRCPFESEHTSDSGETSTAYFLAGTGGYERGHVKCLHAHCMGRDDHDYQVATGYIGAGFAALPLRAAEVVLPADTVSHDVLMLTEEIGDLPRLDRDKNGKIEANADNLNKLLRLPDFTGVRLGYDVFRGAIMWAPARQDPPQWREFRDVDYVNLEIALHRRGVDSVGHETLRRWVRKAADDCQFDSAREWLQRLAWDGVPRVERFLAAYMGVRDDGFGYASAVSRYIWTALAGRVLEPGIQADMVPILFGEQGLRKTSAIRALVPSPDFYATIDMSVRDDDTARLMRGTLVNELEELRGLKSRDAESIKAWITKSGDKWTPKYVEFASTYLRRSVFFGTTNRDDFLDDPTGERRWLPTTVGVAGPIDVDAIVRDREQLWAEGAIAFMLDGIAWQDAERLAPTEQDAFKADDSYVPLIMRWLETPSISGEKPRAKMDRLTGEGLTNHDIAVAIGAASGKPDRSVSTQVGIAMRKLRFVSRQVGSARVRHWFEAP